MSEFVRGYGYNDEGDPVLEIRRKIDPHNRVYQIPLGKLWVFSRDHNRAFLQSMFNVCRDVYQFLGVGNFLILSSGSRLRVMSDIAGVIEGGIEDVLRMPNAAAREVDDGVVCNLKLKMGDKVVSEREIDSREEIKRAAESRLSCL